MPQHALPILVTTEAVRRLREGQERIHACVKRLSDEQLWHRPNPQVVSVGNLVLHLAGNVGQWINATLGNAPDQRERQAEFDTPAMDRRALLDRLDSTLVRALEVVRGLTAADLERSWRVQGFQESGLAIVLHVVEHFSYHVGQITLHTKLLLAIDTGYYAGQDLERKG
ncbi:MAG: DUF1572 family protein [Flavobacteriales bacterium]|nr:DUF1572 family protein [Flavobacteriales bacterium]